MNKEHLKRQREYRKRTGNKTTKKYEKTPNGFLVRMYRNMQSRTCGIQKKKAHLYKGLYLLERQDFYKWAKENDVFWKLYQHWVKSSYDRKLTPTVDRIDSEIGYSLNNMEWVTHSENSRRGALSRRRYSPNLQETVRS
jgi:hypothetical protein